MTRLLLRTSALLLVALALAACGGKAETSTAVTPPGTGTSAVPQPAASATAAAAAPLVNAGFCTGWGSAAAAAAPSGPPAGAAGSPANLKANMDAATTAMKSMADQAPVEIRGDFQVYAKAFSDYAAVMAKANYDFTKLATDPELLKGMQAMADPKVQQAGLNIQAWASKNCAGR